MTVVACAALSARWIAEALARDGCAAWALDLFGDADTRAAARAWRPIGDAAALRLEAAPLLAALSEARADGAIGWIAGSGFEAAPALLEAGAEVLPLIGTAPAAQARVRDPAGFFDTLARLGVPHPGVRLEPPAEPGDWLVKQMDACGGSHVQPAGTGPWEQAPQRYWQRRERGRPMSALFVANRRRACRIAFNELIVRPHGGAPYAYHGAIGPAMLPEADARAIDAWLDALAEHYQLAGLASLDFLYDGTPSVLELNPRPSASAALYPDAGLTRMHLDACRLGALPARPPTFVDVRGCELVPAPAEIEMPMLAGPGGAEPGCGLPMPQAALEPAAPARGQAAGLRQAGASPLSALPTLHDVPRPGSLIPAGAPLASVGARAQDADAVRAALARGRARLLNHLLQETSA